MTMFRTALLLAAFCACHAASAQVPVVANPNHEQLLYSADPVLAANKLLVYNFQREVLEAGHLSLAAQYLSDDYIQHNPNVPTGRAGFVDYFSTFMKASDILPKVSMPIVQLTAEGDLVILTTLARMPLPGGAGKTYTTSWFDMFRIKDGKIVEHWDPMTKR
jgi:predicted SnoaL-like aldol condensation-catalyzing enzyme